MSTTAIPLRRRFQQALRACVCLGLLAAGAPAFAQWHVTDETTQTKIDNLKQDVNERLDKIYKQSHVKSDAYDTSKNKTLSLQDDNDSKMSERNDASDLQSSRCRVQPDNAVSTDQNKICTDMVTKEVKLNNYLVKMLELTKKRQEELNAILQERKQIDTGAETEFGSLESNTNKLLALQTQIQIDQMNLRLTMDSYSRYFTDQNAKLADLTRDLQRGKGSSFVDGAVRSALLTAALAGAHLYQSNAQE
ncbi:hypothetical protein [Pseudoxanthomonas winnipegensis]|uniref:Uncharacterized protein n=1 Tax=Pseudoxanthomonas winnipegensis TaxID=2480810 RepID=A0A4Q8LF58_9GAMM|nr:hypothetical protein [Pseudoxanthomonas winnipegensis]RZZ88966.1 hypothetical protein EA662_00780 [Pseudoxanthomonas winnipegensis]TAA27325.1 hypothetical protein EA661_14410 [Pseudoxanthomonas winnipegensis]TAA38948.1 hypothetical protein EAT51_15320 [Pseudoxanthomonas winnipegensis]TBV75611.1 hypothetical protein EYC46_10005 [Pseudoxanthomonas winnipegensis]